MHDKQYIQFLGLLPKRIELFAFVVLSVDIRRDQTAAKVKVSNGALQNARSPWRILHGNRGHRHETFGVFLDEILQRIIKEVAPRLATLAVESIADIARRGIG